MTTIVLVIHLLIALALVGVVLLVVLFERLAHHELAVLGVVQVARFAFFDEGFLRGVCIL